MPEKQVVNILFFLIFQTVSGIVQGQYSMFIALLPFLDPLMFYLAMRQNAETQAVTGAEKTAFAWFAALTLLLKQSFQEQIFMC